MKIQKYKIVNIVVTCLLALAMVFTTEVPISMAKEKATLSDSKMTIGIGSHGQQNGFFNKSQNKYQILLYNTQKGAKYTFASTNKKIVTVKSSGKYAYLTGVKKGSATITCKQKLKGKTTTVGKCKVTVKNASLNLAYTKEENLPMGTGKIPKIDDSIFNIENRNTNASYTFTTDSSDLTIKEKVVKVPKDFMGAPGYFYFGQAYTAKKEGTYKVTVTEKYKKKNRKVGTFKVVIHKTKITEQLSVGINDSVDLNTLLEYKRADMSYYIVGDGFDVSKKSKDSIIYIDSDGSNAYIYGVNEGTAKLNIYEGKSESDRVLLGTCTVTVKKVPVESISFDEKSYSTYVGAPKNDDTLYLYLSKEPYNASDDVIVTSSDEKIAKVVYDADAEGYKVIPVKEGKVTIKATCGNKTATCEISITADEYGDDLEEDESSSDVGDEYESDVNEYRSAIVEE
ncbi:hypothetical protein bsdtb5_38640 [Anaeromicropila herbilytica]|uniref:BIG2 domain-containing protein n=2 Tax=Anaeromicropila herbilytica TaxID=2785025 RepID=A0A7R7IEX2_9FIRM|nr:hypothetical protein bsdtb5_38640 [Anaeromicropila herbilytica]